MSLRRVLIFFILGLASLGAQASGQTLANNFTIEGRLYDSTGAPLNSASVDIVLEVLNYSGNAGGSLNAAACVLYAESWPGLNVSSSDANSVGVFALPLGKGTALTGTFSSALFANPSSPTNSTFVNENNSGTITYTGSCTALISPLDQRVVRIKVREGGALYEALNPDTLIGTTPAAMVADSLQGYSASQFLMTNANTSLSQGNVETVFTNTNFANLIALLNGTSNAYLNASGGAFNFGGDKLTNVAAPLAGTDATNKNYVDSSVAGHSVSLTGIANGQTLVWNSTTSTWQAGNDGGVQSITAGPGLGGGTITSTGSLYVDVGTTAGKILQVTASGYPALDGFSISNLNAITGLTGDVVTTSGHGVVTATIGPNAVSLSKMNVGGAGGPGYLLMSDSVTGTNLVYKGCAVNQVLQWAAGGWTCTDVAALLGNNGVVPDSYGSSTQVTQLAVDAQGLVTAVSSVNIAYPVTMVAGHTGNIVLNPSDISGLGTIANWDYGSTFVTAGTLINVDVGTAANQIVQLNISGGLPGVDGSLLSNVNAVKLQTHAVGAITPVGGQVLGWNAATSQWEPMNTATGSVTSVLAGPGLAGGDITSAGSLYVDTGTAANKILQLNAAAQIPAVDGSQLFNVNAQSVQGKLVSGTSPTPGQVLTFNSSSGKLDFETPDTNLGTVTSVVAGSGLIATTITANGTLNVDVGTAANKILQLNGSAQIPGVDGSLLAGVSAAKLQQRNISAVAPVGGQVLAWNSGDSQWEPAAITGGTVTSVTNGPGLLGGPISSSGSLYVDTGTSANKIVQLTASAQYPAVDGYLVTNLNAQNLRNVFPLLANPIGTPAAPAYSFNGNANTGLLSPASNMVAISTAGSERLRVDNNGNVGIGTPTPQAALDVANTGALASAIIVPRDTTANRPSTPVAGMIRYNTSTNAFEGYANGGWGALAAGGGASSSGVAGAIQFSDGAGGFSSNNGFDINPGTGNVGIGTQSPQAALDVSATGSFSAIIVPRDSTANRPSAAVAGMIRYNTSTSSFEGYNSGAWSPLLQALPGLSSGNIWIGSSGGVAQPVSPNGDVIMTNSGSFTVAGLQGRAVSSIAPSDAQILLFNGVASDWMPASVHGDLSFASSGLVTVRGIQGVTVSATASMPSAGEILTYNNTMANWDAEKLSSASIAFPIVAPGGSAAAPPFAFTTSATTGVFSPAANMLAVTTGGTERMRIDNNGNTGIGTTVPAFTLDVEGSTTAGGSILKVENTNFSGNSELALFSNSGTKSAVLGFGNSTGYTYLQGLGASGLAFETSGGTRMAIQSGGNVGISQSGPTSKLDVGGNVSIGSIYSGTYAAPANGLIVSGIVGIGTPTPQAALDVATTGVSSAIIVPRDTSANRPTAPVNGMIRYNTSINSLESFVNGAWTAIATGASTANAFVNGGNTFGASSSLGNKDGNSLNFMTNNAIQMTITSAGNVGIGLSNPTAPLHVFTTSATSGIFGDATASNSSGVYGESDGGSGNGVYGYAPSGNGVYGYGNDGVLGQGSIFGVQGQATAAGAIGVFASNPYGGTALSVSGPSVLSGNVAIGSTSPAAALDVQSTGSNSAIIVPRDTTANRPAGIAGMVRYNTSTNSLEAYANGSWQAIIGSAGGTLTGPLVSSDGSSASPGISFTNDPSTGFYDYNPGTGTIGVTSGGVEEFQFSSLGLSSTSTGSALIAQATGSATAPTYSFVGDTTTGWFHPANGMLAASTAGSERMRIDGSGNVGIGTSSPLAQLDVEATTSTSSGFTQSNFAVATTGTTNLTSPIYAENSLARHNVGTTASLMYGNNGMVQNAGAGAITNAYGNSGTVRNTSTTGTISNAYAIYGAVANATGVITNSYGVYVGTVNGTNHWSVYANDSTSSSYFAGNVGIGVTSPNTALAVQSSSVAATAVFRGTSTASGVLAIDNSSGAADSYIMYESGGAMQWQLGDQANGTFFLWDVINSKNELTSINGNLALEPTSGNVGIGTASPGATLDVAGQIRTSGTIPTVSGTSCGTGATITGTDQSGKLTLGTGVTTGTICTINFHAPLTNAPNSCILFPGSANASGAPPYISSITNSSWSISGLNGYSSASFYYQCF